MAHKTIRYLLLLALTVLTTASLMMAAGRGPEDEPTAEDADTSQVATGGEGVETGTRNWPTESRNIAMQMVQKYGEPDVVSDEHLMWMNKGDFHEISVYREQVEHNFPSKHMDVVQHKVYMKVPAEKVDELSQFDGSITVNRTRGLVASFCNSEQANIAALNLAADIVNNRRSVQEARQMMASLVGTGGTMGTTGTTVGTMGGTTGGDYVETLRFDTDNQNTARDPGQPLTARTTGTTGMGTGTGTGTGRGTTPRDSTDTLRFDTTGMDTIGADTTGSINDDRGTGDDE